MANTFPCLKASKAAEEEDKLKFREREKGEDAPEIGESVLEGVEAVLGEGVFTGAETHGIEEALRNDFEHDSRRDRASKSGV